jgi:hypothetical protein
MRRLPDYYVTVQQISNDYLAVGAHEHLGARYYTKFALADIPKHLTREEDLIGFVLHTIDLRSICQGETDIALHGDQLAIDRPFDGDGSKLNNRHSAAIIS